MSYDFEITWRKVADVIDHLGGDVIAASGHACTADFSDKASRDAAATAIEEAKLGRAEKLFTHRILVWKLERHSQ